MRDNTHLMILLALCAVTLSACAAGLSRQAKDQVTYFGSFAQLQNQPEQYTGDVVMLGGKIIDIAVDEGASDLTVLQLPLNSSDRPDDNDASQGRFIVTSTEFMDPAIFSEGALVTVIGTVKEGRRQLIGKMNYLYPVVKAIEIKKWSPQGAGPRFHFGFGIGTTF